jgi:peptidoglycan-associated lipoprotein
MFRKLLSLAATLSVILGLVAGCKSKPKATDQDLQSAPGAAATIDSTPLSFDTAGSDSGKIDGLKTVYFPYDKSSLEAQAKKDLAGNAEWLKARPGIKLQIEGHCDERGTIEYNVALGERRANTVKAHLVSLGIPSDRLSTISYGEEKPLVTGDSESVWTKNRRANFVPLQ